LSPLVWPHDDDDIPDIVGDADDRSTALKWATDWRPLALYCTCEATGGTSGAARTSGTTSSTSPSGASGGTSGIAMTSGTARTSGITTSEPQLPGLLRLPEHEEEEEDDPRMGGGQWRTTPRLAAEGVDSPQFVEQVRLSPELPIDLVWVLGPTGVLREMPATLAARYWVPSQVPYQPLK
jgi:hypothetical protein